MRDTFPKGKEDISWRTTPEVVLLVLTGTHMYSHKHTYTCTQRQCRPFGGPIESSFLNLFPLGAEGAGVAFYLQNVLTEPPKVRLESACQMVRSALALSVERNWMGWKHVQSPAREEPGFLHLISVPSPNSASSPSQAQDRCPSQTD